jgi:hypothetical protein
MLLKMEFVEFVEFVKFVEFVEGFVAEKGPCL